MTRQSGILLALPPAALHQSFKEDRGSITPDELIGPCQEVLVPAVMEMEDGTERSLDFELPILLVDFSAEVIPMLRQLDPVTEGPGILCFSEEDMDVLPSSPDLMSLAMTCVGQSQEDRTHFYSAAEEERHMTPPPAKAKAKAKAGPKKVTTAALSEQLASLAQTLPAISSQLQQLQAKQSHFESLLANPPATPKLPPYRQQFDLPVRSPAIASPAQYLRQMGNPPRVRAPNPGSVQAPLPEDEPAHPQEEGLIPEEGQMDIAMSLFQQQKALTTLVAHLASQDGLQDLTAGSSSSSAISLKGSAKRERLMADLASRKGGFLLKVAQNAFKRLKPTEPLPSSLQEFGGKAVFTKYLERQGGYGGQQRDIGLTMWLLSHIADQIVEGLLLIFKTSWILQR
eukprot:s47_g38.t1